MKHVEDMASDGEEPCDYSDGDTSASDDALEYFNADTDSEKTVDDDVATGAGTAAAADPGSTADGITALLNGDVGPDAGILDLEIRQLLKQVQVGYATHTQTVTQTLEQLRAALSSLPETKVSASAAPDYLGAWGIDPSFTFTPAPPTHVQLVGSWPQHTAADQTALGQLAAAAGSTGRGAGSTVLPAVVDVAVQMPHSCFLHKDQLNYRYHARRALYLLAMARHLSQHPLTSSYSQQLQPLRGDPHRPVLVLAPGGSSSSNGSTQQPPLLFQLLLVPPADAFPLHRLAPERNSLRWVVKAPTAVVDQAHAEAAGGADTNQPQQEQWLPTPQYNAAVLQDMLGVVHYQYVVQQLKQLPAAVAALLLLKVWAHQCGVAVHCTPAISLGSAAVDSSNSDTGATGYCQVDGLSGHLLTLILLAAVERTGPTALVMTPLQLFRTALQLLADRAAWSKGVALSTVKAVALTAGGEQQQLQLPPPPTPASFKKHYPVVLIDHTGWFNAAAGVTASSLAVAATAADRTLAALRSTADPIDVVTGAFHTPRPAHSGFDYYWQVQLPGQANGLTGQRVGEVSSSRAEELRVEGLVRSALKGRATLVRALPRSLHFPQSASAPGRGKGKGRSSRNQQQAALLPATPARPSICVGVLVDPLQCLKLVDVGPAADDARAAAKWQALWGDRSELRRFQDGRICEVVAWEVPPDDRHTIPDLAVGHLLGRHLPAGTRITGCAGALDPVLRPHGLLDVAASRAADAALDKLSKQLRALSEVALKVVGVQPLSAASRRTPGFYPQPHPLAGALGQMSAGGVHLPRCIQPLEVMVQLEASGRWPDHPTAYLKMKAALGVQLATALSTATALRVEAAEEYLDVYCDGFVYRLYLFSERDEAMHAKGPPTGQSLTNGQHGQHHHAVAHAPPRSLQLAWHQGLIAGLEGSNAAFGPSCRLAKRWVGAQLLLGAHLAEEVVELLVAAAFARARPWGRPGSRLAGLLAFLQLLTSFPWSAAPLLVDPAAEVTQEARRQLHREFEARRTAGTAPAMFLATPRDLHASRWTLEHPSAHVLQHLVAVARQAESALNQLLALGPELYPALQRQEAAAAQRVAGVAKLRCSEPQQRLLAAAWLQLFVTPFQDFDVILVLRKEAVPYSEHLLPAQAAAWKLQQELLTTGLGRGSNSKKRGRVQEADGAAIVAEPPPKQARAVLRAFPAQLAEEAPTEQLVNELLVGFDPVKLYVQLLTERFGHLAIFCCDSAAGLPVVAGKWRPEAFLPSALRPALAHTSMELGLTSLTTSKGGGLCSGPRSGLVVPNVPQVLHEMQLMGVGLVQQVVLKQ